MSLECTAWEGQAQNVFAKLCASMQYFSELHFTFCGLEGELHVIGALGAAVGW